jgi:hypothetical protein
MKVFDTIMRNWFIGMILFVLTALVLSVNTTNAAITSPYVQEKAPSFLFHNEISQIAFNVIENDLENCCQNERNLVAYRNWAVSPGAIAAKTSTSIWSSTSKLSSVKNAFGHWKKHAAEFPEFVNAKQYVEGAKNFLHNSPAGTLMKTRANGDILKYHPGTNTFGVMDATGVPRTMFRPTDGMKYWLGL